MKCTWPTRDPTPRTQRKLYSTGWRWVLASGVTQILALGNAKIYQHVVISNAKFWRRGHCPTPTPDARYFAFWWNIGLSLKPIFHQNAKCWRWPCIFHIFCVDFIFVCTQREPNFRWNMGLTLPCDDVKSVQTAPYVHMKHTCI